MPRIFIINFAYAAIVALFDFGRRNQSKIEKKCVAKFLPRIRVVRVNSDIEKLLNLQTKDAALSAIKGRLDAVPQEIESKRAEIRAVEKNCDAAREKLRATQARRDEMRSQRRALEENEQ